MLCCIVFSITFSSEEIYLGQERREKTQPCESKVTLWRMVLGGLQSKLGPPVTTAVGKEPSGTQGGIPGAEWGLPLSCCTALMHQEHPQQQAEGGGGCSRCFLTASISWGLTKNPYLLRWQRSISKWRALWDFLSASHSRRETISQQSAFQIISVDNDGLAMLPKTESLKRNKSLWAWQWVKCYRIFLSLAMV